jgi:hypothetical protein
MRARATASVASSNSHSSFVPNGKSTNMIIFQLLTDDRKSITPRNPHLKFAIRSHLVRCTSNKQSVMIPCPNERLKKAATILIALRRALLRLCMDFLNAAKIGTAIASKLLSQR